STAFLPSKLQDRTCLIWLDGPRHLDFPLGVREGTVLGRVGCKFVQGQCEVLSVLRREQYTYAADARALREHLQFSADKLIKVHSTPIRSYQGAIGASECL